MKAFARNPRTGLPALAVFVTLVLSFAVPPLSSVVAAGSSSGSMSSSSTPSCNGTFSAGTVTPGQTVQGVLKLNKDNGCRFVAGQKVDVALNGAHLSKDPDQNGDVSVSVKINSLTKGVLDDPVDVDLHQGTNTVVVTGTAESNGANVGTATINASFNLVPAQTPVSVTPTTVAVTPVVQQTTGGSGLLLLALVAIALGTYTVASERAVPVAVGAGGGAGLGAASVTLPLFDPRLGAEQWTLEVAVLTAVSYILGPPPGRHAKKGPRGLVPMARDWFYRER
jgi:hypothetical protein